MRTSVKREKMVVCAGAAFGTVFIMERMAELAGFLPKVFGGSVLAAGILIAVFLSYSRKWEEKRTCYCFFFFILIFLYSEFMGFYVAADGVRNRHDFSWEYCILAFFLSAALAWPFSGYVEKTAELLLRGNFENTPFNRKKRFFLYLGIFIICWIPYYLAFYPGVYCYDIPLQWRQYLNHSYGTWNPVVHSFLFGIICDMGNALLGRGTDYNRGLALYSFLQMVAVAVSLAYACVCVDEYVVPAKAKRFLVLFFAFFPLFPLMGISTTKDTFFATLFVVSVLKLIQICDESGKEQKRYRIYQFMAWTVLMSLFRNNALYGIVLSCIMVAMLGTIFFLRERPRAFFIGKICGVLTVTALLSLAAGAGMTGISHATTDNKGEKLSLPGQQIARVYLYQYDTLDEESIRQIEYFYEKEALQGYIPDIADPVKNGWNYLAYEENTADYYKLWLTLGLRYPREYIVAFLLNTQGLWHIGDMTSAEIRGAWLELGFWKPVDEQHLVYEQSFFPEGKRLILEWNQNRNYQKIPIFQVLFASAVYNWLYVAAITLLVWKKRWIAVIPGMFILGYSVTLLLGPCILLRYCLPVIIVAPVYIMYAISECRKYKE